MTPTVYSVTWVGLNVTTRWLLVAALLRRTLMFRVILCGFYLVRPFNDLHIRFKALLHFSDLSHLGFDSFQSIQ